MLLITVSHVIDPLCDVLIGCSVIGVNDPLCDVLIGHSVIDWGEWPTLWYADWLLTVCYGDCLFLSTDNMFVNEYDDDDDIFLSDTLNTEQNVCMHCIVFGC